MKTFDLMLTSDTAGVTESGKLVPVGTKVEYKGHVSGGMVKVCLPDGAIEIMHPLSIMLEVAARKKR